MPEPPGACLGALRATNLGSPETPRGLGGTSGGPQMLARAPRSLPGRSPSHQGTPPWTLSGPQWTPPRTGMRPGPTRSAPRIRQQSAQDPPETLKDPLCSRWANVQIRCVFHCFEGFGAPGLSKSFPKLTRALDLEPHGAPQGAKEPSLTQRKRKLGVGKTAQRGAGAAGRLAETWQAGWT